MIETIAPAADVETFGLVWPGKRAAALLADTPTQCHFSTPLPARTSPYTVIAGDNLDALELVAPRYQGNIKLIYIDPPYNTGNTFVFRDRFTDRAAAAQDVATRQHAAWLSLMYPRLLLAHRLLREDGALFVSIGPEELHNLLALLHEIFGPGCFKNIIVVRRGAKNVQAQFATIEALNRGHEYVVFFSKSPKTRYPKLLVPEGASAQGTWNNHWRGTERPTMRYALFGIVPERGQWRWSEARSQEAMQNYARLCFEVGDGNPDQRAIDRWVAREQERAGVKVNLLRLSKTGKPEHYVPPAPGKLASDLWTDIKPNGSAQLRRIFGPLKLFDTPKSVDLVRRIVEFATAPEDIVLDFFAGTCTTAHAVIAANAADDGSRKCICVQTSDPLPQPVTLPDGVTLTTIADIGVERIRRILALHGLPETALWQTAIVE